MVDTQRSVDIGACHICWDDIPKRGGKAVLLCGNCEKSFHLDCIFKNVEKNGDACPYCRQSLNNGWPEELKRFSTEELVQERVKVQVTELAQRMIKVDEEYQRAEAIRTEAEQHIIKVEEQMDRVDKMSVRVTNLLDRCEKSHEMIMREVRPLKRKSSMFARFKQQRLTRLIIAEYKNKQTTYHQERVKRKKVRHLKRILAFEEKRRQRLASVGSANGEADQS